MNQTAEKLAATAKANVEALQALGSEIQADATKLVELNLATSKSVLAESIQHAQAVMSAKDPQTLSTLQTNLAKSLAEKFQSYVQDFQKIATSAGAEFTKTAQANMAEVQKNFATLMETATKDAPAGTESAMAFFNKAISASQNAFATAQSNFSAATAQAVDAMKKATKS